MRAKRLCKGKTQVENLSPAPQALHWHGVDVLSLSSGCADDLYTVCLLNICFRWSVGDLSWFLEPIPVHWTHPGSLNLAWFIEPLFSRPGAQGCHSSRYSSERFPSQGWTVLRVHWRQVIRLLGERWLSWIGHCGGPWAWFSKSRGRVNLCGLNRREECDAQFVLTSHRDSACLHLELSPRPARH